MLFQGVQQVLAGAFAAAAGLLADPAVLVVRGVPPAFIAAALFRGTRLPYSVAWLAGGEPFDESQLKPLAADDLEAFRRGPGTAGGG